jgi:hypothetical protein
MKTENQIRAQNRSDIIITANQAVWEFRIDGDYSGTFTGTFKFRCYLTPTQRIAVGREQRELLGSIANLAADDESTFAMMLTHLKYRVLEAPPFWSANTGFGYAGDLLDENVLTQVFVTALDAELKYKAILIDRKEQAIAKVKAGAEEIQNSRDEKKKEKPEEDEAGGEF